MNNEGMNPNPTNNETEPLISADLGNLNPAPANSEVLGETAEVSAEVNAPAETLDGPEMLNDGVNPVNNDIPTITTVESDQTMVIEPTKKKKKGPVVFLVVLVLLAILGGLGYVFRDKILSILPFGKSTPRAIFESAIDRIDTKNMFNINSKTTTGSFKLSLEPSSDSDYKSFELGGNYYYDKASEYIKTSLTAKYGNDSLDADVYVINDDAYIYAKEILDKYMTTPIEGLWNMTSSVESEIDLENLDLNGIAERLLANVKKSLKDEYFTQTKEGNLTKSTFNLAGINQLKFEKDLITNNKNDSKLISLLEKAGIDKDEIIEGFDESIKAYEELIADYKESDSSTTRPASISIYTTSSKNIAKIEINSDTITIIIDSIIKGGFDYRITSSEKDFEDITGKVTYTSSQTEPSCSISINTSMGKITFETTTKYNASFEKEEIDKTKVVNIAELDEMDQLFIEINVMNNKFLMSLIEDFSSGEVAPSLEDVLSE